MSKADEEVVWHEYEFECTECEMEVSIDSISFTADTSIRVTISCPVHGGLVYTLNFMCLMSWCHAQDHGLVTTSKEEKC